VREQPNDLYFVSPIVDSLFVGVASILCFLFYRLTSSGYSGLQLDQRVILIAATLAWVGSWPHFSATAWRLYETKERVARFPLTALLLPVLFALAALACFIYPVSFAPTFLKLFILWSPWHFSLQTFGITLIYARRAGIDISPAAKKALGLFFVSSFLVQYTEVERSMSVGFMYALFYPQLDLPAFITPLASGAMYASLAFAGWSIFPTFRSRGLPWIFLLPILTQYLWFVHGAKVLSFQLLLPLFHGLQYLLIAWAIEIQARGRSLGVARATSRWALVNFTVGAIFFFGIPRLLAWFGFDLAFSTLVFLAAVSVHHYFVDGVIWKIREEGQRSPLFSNVRWAWQPEERR